MASTNNRKRSGKYNDTIRIESEDGNSFDRFTSLSLSSDFERPSEAAFEVGDDGTWNEFQSVTGLGKQFKIFVNDRLFLSGRVELNDLPIDASSGAITRFTIRTKTADAMYASANPKVRVVSSSIKNFVLELWKPLGFVESDFIFNADLSRDLITGVSSNGTKSPIDLEEMKEENAKVNPPETIYQATQRHLNRHGLMIWDAPNGKMVIGTPDDEQLPIYQFRMYSDRTRGAFNNILSAHKTLDWSGVPGTLMVAGTSGDKDWTKSAIRGFAFRDEVRNAGFYRPVLIVNEGLKTDAMAKRQADLEMTNRSKQMDNWSITTDGLSFYDGHQRYQYTINTVAEIFCSAAGGPVGNYLITRVEHTRNVSDGDTTDLTLLKKGIWRM